MNSLTLVIAALSAYTVSAALVCDAPNEVHSNVTPMCPRTCTRQPICLGLINKESCQCAQGYVRVSNTNTTCVKDEDCPTKKMVCDGPHQLHSDYTPLCPRTCDNINGVICLGMAHKESCQCEPGYIFKSATDKTCISEEKCVARRSLDDKPTLCSGQHEYQEKYTPVCPLTCETRNKMRCLALLDKPSCQCKDGTIRDTTSNKCVPADECPAQSKKLYAEEQPIVCDAPNERFSEWISACPAKCPLPGTPPAAMTCQAIVYKPSCVCTNGTIRDTVNNRCVKPDDCPAKREKRYAEEQPIVCDAPNERFSEWISACPDKCPLVGSKPSPMKCLAIIHKPSCVCANGTIRDTVNNRCVKPQDCPPVSAFYNQ